VSEAQADRVRRIEARLREAFAPERLWVEDESHRHRGHAGAQGGRGHFRVEIVSSAFAGQGRLDRHRAVYGALARELESEIHALALLALTPEEWRARASGP
jgi:BolA protein